MPALPWGSGCTWHLSVLLLSPRDRQRFFFWHPEVSHSSAPHPRHCFTHCRASRAGRRGAVQPRCPAAPSPNTHTNFSPQCLPDFQLPSSPAEGQPPQQGAPGVPPWAPSGVKLNQNKQVFISEPPRTRVQHRARRSTALKHSGEAPWARGGQHPSLQGDSVQSSELLAGHGHHERGEGRWRGTSQAQRSSCPTAAWSMSRYHFSLSGRGRALILTSTGQGLRRCRIKTLQRCFSAWGVCSSCFREQKRVLTLSPWYLQLLVLTSKLLGSRMACELAIMSSSRV